MNLFGLFGKNEKEAEQPSVSAPAEENVADVVPFARNILVIVDGSQRGMDAVDSAISLASSMRNCKLNAAFVIDTASMDLLLQMHIFVKEERQSFEAEMEVKGRHTLEYVHAEGIKNSIEIDTFLLKGRASKIILQAARELGVDLIVIGGWSDGGTRKDAASVEYQLLLEQAECQVLIVKKNKSSEK